MYIYLFLPLLTTRAVIECEILAISLSNCMWSINVANRWKLKYYLCLVSVPIKNLLLDLSIAYVQLSNDRSWLYLSIYASCRWKLQCYLWFGSFRTLETGSAIVITNLLQIATCYMFPAIQLTWHLQISDGQSTVVVPPLSLYPFLYRRYSYVDRANVTGRGT